MAVFDEKLQNAKASITERGIFMFNNELLSDVSLVVRASSDHEEPKKSKMAIPAHKFVLLRTVPPFVTAHTFYASAAMLGRARLE